MLGVMNVLELEVRMTVSCHMDAENYTKVLSRAASALSYWVSSSSPWLQKVIVLLCLSDEALHILLMLQKVSKKRWQPNKFMYNKLTTISQENVIDIFYWLLKTKIFVFPERKWMNLSCEKCNTLKMKIIWSKCISLTWQLYHMQI